MTEQKVDYVTRSQYSPPPGNPQPIQSIIPTPSFSLPMPLPVTLNGKLGFNDGLNFGCGFWVAGFLFFAIALPLGIMATLLSIALFGQLLTALVGG